MLFPCAITATQFASPLSFSYSLAFARRHSSCPLCAAAAWKGEGVLAFAKPVTKRDSLVQYCVSFDHHCHCANQLAMVCSSTLCSPVPHARIRSSQPARAPGGRSATITPLDKHGVSTSLSPSSSNTCSALRHAFHPSIIPGIYPNQARERSLYKLSQSRSLFPSDILIHPPALVFFTRWLPFLKLLHPPPSFVSAPGV